MTSPKTVTPDQPQAVPGQLYLIRKGGGYYRPNAQGYTRIASEAGQYTLEEAIRHSHPNGLDGSRDGIDYVPAPARPVLPVETPAIPVGWYLVPEVPTEDQMQAGLYQSSHDSDYASVCQSYMDMVRTPVDLPVETPAEGLRDPYYGALNDCLVRYRGMVAWAGRRDLVEFIREFAEAIDNAAPLMKLNRWLGYIQGQLIAAGLTTVEAERNWTRPLFRPLDFPASTTPAPLSGRDGSFRDASERVLEWYDRDGSVGTIGDVMEPLRAALAAVPPETAEMEGDLTAAYLASVEKGRDEWKVRAETVIRERDEANAKNYTLCRDAADEERAYILQFLSEPNSQYRSYADRLAARASSSGEAGDETRR